MRNFAEDVSSARLLDTSQAANSGGSGCIAPELDGGASPFKAQATGSGAQSQEPNPPKRQKLAQRSKEEGDRAGSGAVDENMEDLDGPWDAGMSDIGQVFRFSCSKWSTRNALMLKIESHCGFSLFTEGSSLISSI